MLQKFFIKTPWWARLLFPSYVWRIPTAQKIVYLTFDDGPHPTITPWVLSQLKTYAAKATFFCIGNNVAKHPETYQRILQEGHSVGNHTYDHFNGWKTDTTAYLKNIQEAANLIRSNLFRPPYGKIKVSQAKSIREAMGTKQGKIIMWDVLSADFDKKVAPNDCTRNVLENVSPGSIIVFHDSEKAFANLQMVLPQVLKTLKKEGYEFWKITMEGH